jgi:hypothetical protein
MRASRVAQCVREACWSTEGKPRAQPADELPSCFSLPRRRQMRSLASRGPSSRAVRPGSINSRGRALFLSRRFAPTAASHCSGCPSRWRERRRDPRRAGGRAKHGYSPYPLDVKRPRRPVKALGRRRQRTRPSGSARRSCLGLARVADGGPYWSRAQAVPQRAPRSVPDDRPRPQGPLQGVSDELEPCACDPSVDSPLAGPPSRSQFFLDMDDLPCRDMYLGQGCEDPEDSCDYRHDGRAWPVSPIARSACQIIDRRCLPALLPGSGTQSGTGGRAALRLGRAGGGGAFPSDP